MKAVFIASSSESLPIARRLARIVAVIPDVEVRVWEDLFPPGFVPFEVLQRQARAVSGAVILAAPDDVSTVRSHKVRVPRSNVLLEYGYFAAILGTHRIALCKFDEAYLPSDAAGMTYISMQKYPKSDGDVDDYEVPNAATERLQQWAHNLPHTPNGLPLIMPVHGYTGRWEATVVFDRWRGLTVDGPDFVHVNCHLDLYIDDYHGRGFGIGWGELYVKIGECHAQFSVVDRIDGIVCSPDGSLEFHSYKHARECISISGTPPQEDGFTTTVGPYAFLWKVRPHATDPQCMSGEYFRYGGDQVRSHAKVIMRKV